MDYGDEVHTFVGLNLFALIKYHKTPNMVVTLTLDMKGRPTNIINHEIVSAFVPVLEVLKSESEKGQLVGVIVTSGKPTFLTGGDLDYLYDETNPHKIFEFAERLNQFFRQLEKIGVPVVAALNGTALGSGFELALACHYRVALNNPASRFGSPEVTLGMMPGGGAVIRLMWMLGIEKALPILTEGKRYTVLQAFHLGLIDEVAETEEQMLEQAERWILSHPNMRQPWDDKGKIPGGTPSSSPKTAQYLGAATAVMIKRTRGHYPAVKAILQTMADGAMVDFDTALRLESRAFASLFSNQVLRNMVMAFWYNLNEIHEGKSRPKGYGLFRPREVGVIGAGMMGSGIAYACCRAGIKVVLKDVSRTVAEIGKSYSERLLAAEVQLGKLSPEQAKQLLGNILVTDDSGDFKDCDFVIEAVFENRELKNKVTKDAEAILHKEAFIATNTSTLPISSLAVAMKDQSRYIGLHFFSPVEKMNLVEIIVGENTSDETLARAIDFVNHIRKTPIVVKDSRGFFTSRVFSTYVLEGVAMIGEGVPPAMVENAGLLSGMPVGPLALCDEVSLSLILDIDSQAKSDLGGAHVPHKGIEVLKKMVDELGRKGKSKKAGFYEYPEGGKKAIWEGLSEHFPEKSEGQDFELLKDRLMYVQCVETMKCLNEGVVKSVADANIGSIYGWGFAPFTGGALQFVQSVGQVKFQERRGQLREMFGDRFLC